MQLEIINGESKSCNTSLCCTQVVNTITFESCHKLNCKTSFVIYLMECTLCKIQYVGKAETSFNIRLDNHRKNASSNNPKAIFASIHFKQPAHNFRKHAEFTLIKQSNNTINTDIDTIIIRLKRRKDFLILKLDTLALRGINQESLCPPG